MISANTIATLNIRQVYPLKKGLKLTRSSLHLQQGDKRWLIDQRTTTDIQYISKFPADQNFEGPGY